MYTVTIQRGFDMQRYDHRQKKIAMRQFETYKKQSNTTMVTVLHLTKKIDKVVAYWEKEH